MAKIHHVQMGDTYKSIATQHYGSDARAQQIYENNKNRLGNPDHLEPGQYIVIQ